jgi:hypothetical protein
MAIFGTSRLESAGHRLEPEEAGTRFTQVIPPMIPSIQYPARAADPPQSATSPHEPEKRPRLEQLANTGSLRWLRPAGGAIGDRPPGTAQRR